MVPTDTGCGCNVASHVGEADRDGPGAMGDECKAEKASKLG